jgi:hypothetical protein
MFLKSTASNLFFGAALLICALCQASVAQSTDQAFPTAITSNEVAGSIPPRDIGDPRLTTFYYIFNGNRGDVFINIVTDNFNGAIDIFTADGLNPRTKVTIYADNPERETGRVIYQRRDERLILRVQGRTLNDEPATFRLKFAGSFATVTTGVSSAPGEMPSVAAGGEGSIRVNSAGSILPPEPGAGNRSRARNSESSKVERSGAVPDDLKEPVAAEKKTVEKEAKVSSVPSDADGTVAAGKDEKKVRKKPRVIVTDDLEPTEDPDREVTVDLRSKAENETSATVTIERIPEEAVAERPDEAAPAPDKPKEPAEAGKANVAEEKAERNEPAAAVNPLANVFLKVELKDGTRLERRMTEVSSVNVIEGVLTIVLSDGEVRRISILDVLKMTIE